MFNDVLKQLRNKAGMNQEQLAKRLGLPNKADLNTVIFFFEKVIAFVIQLQKLPR